MISTSKESCYVIEKKGTFIRVRFHNQIAVAANKWWVFEFGLSQRKKNCRLIVSTMLAAVMTVAFVATVGPP